ncbi:MAG: GGDEF domain-containing protein [Ilumatobacteraceae bacterium]
MDDLPPTTTATRTVRRSAPRTMIRAFVDPSIVPDPALVLEEVRKNSARFAPRTLATSPVGVIFVAFAAWDRVSGALFIGWLLAFGLTFFMHLEALLVNYRRASNDQTLISPAVTGLTRIGAGLGWGLAVPMLDPGSEDSTLRLLVLLVVLLVGVASGIVIAEGTRAIAEFILGLTVPIAVFYLWDGSDLRWFVIAGSLATVALTMGYGWIWNANVFRVTEAQMTATVLAERLQHELRVTAETAQRYRELSVTVSDLARRDELTGILNRRGLFEAMRVVAVRSEHWFAALIDVDHFKAINDEHGHAVGDTCLRHLAELVREVIGPEVVFGRLGGEEFVVVFEVATSVEAQEFAEVVRDAIERRPPAELDRMTVSIGVATNAGVGASDLVLDMTLMHADEALYEAKGRGRNQVVLRSTDPSD